MAAPGLLPTPCETEDGEEDDGTASETSTIIYEHEPFETFSNKVGMLMTDVFPTLELKAVDRMDGGSYNRVIGATFVDGTRYVVRIPRSPEQPNLNVADQVATLQFVATRLRFPVPAVRHFSVDGNNIIQSPYMVQKRLDGLPLSKFMNELTYEDRRFITLQVAKLTAQICAIMFPSPGIIRARDYLTAEAIRLVVPSREERALEDKLGPSVLRPARNTLEFLIQCFEAHRQRELRHNPRSTSPFMNQLKSITLALYKQQPFSNRFSLFHNDLEPRNILVRRMGHGRLVIVGVLDWDDAASAPIEVAWNLPHWLWTWNMEEEDGLLARADEIPVDPQNRAAKELFEREIEKLVPGFMETWRKGRQLREIFQFAVHGVRTNEDMMRIEQLSKEFGIVRGREAHRG